MSIPPPKIEALFFAASERHDPAERADYLDQACGRGTDLRRRIEELLAAETKVSQFLESPAMPPTLGPGPVVGAASPDAVIGPYSLLEMIGEGGMGFVYLAEQTAPVRRKVALKVIKPGMDTKQVIARFEAERQALAMMDHPNIARVHDAGATGSGRPYFVMELVRGVPITEYCDYEQLGIPHRLDLFILVCRAVQHAHQKGIIHRDLKPSNILVTPQDGVPVPKIIDFGIAKAIGQSLTDKTLFTGHAQLIGTPRYMSPEQADLGGVDIDTRSDIYSLGALLYELLTGSTPFDEQALRQATFDEVRRIIREQSPPRPSTRLSSLGAGLTTVSGQRGSDPRGLVSSVRGELDWIVMKCLEKDRTRRYETASGLARDLMRHLADQPVEACPPSRLYRFAKYARRNRAMLAMASVVSLALIVGTAVSTWQAIRAMDAEKRMAAALDVTEDHRRRAERHLYAFRLRQVQQDIEQGQVERAQERLSSLRNERGEPEASEFARPYLRRLARREITVIADGTRGIGSFALAPDGRELAYITDDGEVVLWDVLADRPRARLGRHTLAHLALAYSPDGTLLASSGRDWDRDVSEIFIWDASARRLLARLDPFGRNKLHSIWFAAGGRVLVVSVSSDDPAVEGVHYLDLGPDPSRPMSILHLRGEPVHVSTPDGHLLGEFTPGRFSKRDLYTGATVWSIPWHAGPVHSLATTPDGRRAAMVVGGREAVILDTASGTVVDRLCLDGPTEPPLIGPDAATVVLPDPAGGALIWDRASNRSRRIPAQQTARTDVSIRAALAPDGKRLALSSRGHPGGQRPPVIYDVATGKLVATYPGRLDQIRRFVFAPDGRTAFLNSGINIQRWSFDRPEADRSLEGHADEAWAVKFSPDGRILASGSDDSEHDDTIKLWDVETGRLVRGWRAQVGTVSALAFFPDGSTIASAGLDTSENLRLWDAATGALRATLAGHTDRVRSVAYSPDGKRLASAGSDRTIRLWDAASGKAIATLAGHTDTVREVAFSPDGHTLASASNDKTARLWDLATGRVNRVFRGARKCSAVAFAPDGSLLAVANEGGDIMLWDRVSGARLAPIHSDHDQLFSLAFAPDSLTLAAAGASRMIHIWDVPTGQELLTLPGHAAQINALAFSPDGRTLASCSHDGAVKLWRSEEPGSSP